MTIQQREQTKKKPGRVATLDEVGPKDFTDNYLPYLLARSSVLMGGEFHAQLPKGMGVPRWRVLAVLADRESLTISKLARMVLLQQPTLTKVVDRLEAEGLVRRGGEADDKRKVVVSITRAGATKVWPLIEQAKAHQATLLENFTARERQILFRVLHNLIDRIQPNDR